MKITSKMCKYVCHVCSHTILFCRGNNYWGALCTGCWGAPSTGLPFVLPMSFDKIDNNNKKTDMADTA